VYAPNYAGIIGAGSLSTPRDKSNASPRDGSELTKYSTSNNPALVSNKCNILFFELLS